VHNRCLDDTNEFFCHFPMNFRFQLVYSTCTDLIENIQEKYLVTSNKDIRILWAVMQ